MCLNIRVHFDGKVLVPEQPVDLPVNQPLSADVTLIGPGVVTPAPEAPSPKLIKERLEKLQGLNGLLDGPVIPLDSLRRENLYDEQV